MTLTQKFFIVKYYYYGNHLNKWLIQLWKSNLNILHLLMLEKCRKKFMLHVISSNLMLISMHKKRSEKIFFVDWKVFGATKVENHEIILCWKFKFNFIFFYRCLLHAFLVVKKWKFWFIKLWFNDRSIFFKTGNLVRQITRTRKFVVKTFYNWENKGRRKYIKENIFSNALKDVQKKLLRDYSNKLCN